ncbi:hypothetical protein RB213_004040 [Colletotrichum asianum]
MPPANRRLRRQTAAFTVLAAVCCGWVVLELLIVLECGREVKTHGQWHQKSERDPIRNSDAKAGGRANVDL